MSKNIIIVTGCANGIGKAIYNSLKENYLVVGVDKEYIPDEEYVHVDIANLFTLKRYLSIYKGKPVVGIINCAGIYSKSTIEESNSAEFDYLVYVNIKPIWFLAQMFLDELKSNNGFVINISSVHSKATLEHSFLYSMTKGAIESLTRGLAVELGKYGIRVNCIRPGAVETRMLNYKDGMEKDIPIGRIAIPNDIVDVVNFLINNTYITGECITVDGGLLANLPTDT